MSGNILRRLDTANDEAVIDRLDRAMHVNPSVLVMEHDGKTYVSMVRQDCAWKQAWFELKSDTGVSVVMSALRELVLGG